MKSPLVQSKTPAEPLSLEERKASLAKIAASAPEKVRRGIALVDLREATAAERKIGNKLAARVRGGGRAA